MVDCVWVVFESAVVGSGVVLCGLTCDFEMGCEEVFLASLCEGLVGSVSGGGEGSVVGLIVIGSACWGVVGVSGGVGPRFGVDKCVLVVVCSFVVVWSCIGLC